MGSITGQSGRVVLNGSYVKFGNWNIQTTDENKVGLVEPWSGSFEIHKPDAFKFMAAAHKFIAAASANGQTHADFYGNENFQTLKYSEEIKIELPPYSTSVDPIVVYFTVKMDQENLKASH